jgi:hypothetical protein
VKQGSDTHVRRLFKKLLYMYSLILGSSSSLCELSLSLCSSLSNCMISFLCLKACPLATIFACRFKTTPRRCHQVKRGTRLQQSCVAHPLEQTRDPSLLQSRLRLHKCKNNTRTTITLQEYLVAWHNTAGIIRKLI